MYFIENQFDMIKQALLIVESKCRFSGSVVYGSVFIYIMNFIIQISDESGFIVNFIIFVLRIEMSDVDFVKIVSNH